MNDLKTMMILHMGKIIETVITFLTRLNDKLSNSIARLEAPEEKSLKLGNTVVMYSPNGIAFVLIGILLGAAIVVPFAMDDDLKTKLAEMKEENLRMKEVVEANVVKMKAMDKFSSYVDSTNTPVDDYRHAFRLKKQLLITEYLVVNNVDRVDQLNIAVLVELNSEISKLFIDLVLPKDLPPHVSDFFIDTTHINKLETALMEQAKFHIPASIKLAQAALETGWGTKVKDNNYFGIKDKTKSTPSSFTTEYFNEAEVMRNEDIIVSKQKIKKDGKTLYKCKIRDSFVRYETPWQSFRAHSMFLVNNDRYAPLFKHGKKYEAWADKIGSSKEGGVGYATSPIYGTQLKNIIEQFHLDLLDL